MCRISVYNKIFTLDIPAIYYENKDTDCKIIKEFRQFVIISLELKVLASGLQNEYIATLEEDKINLGNNVRTILEELRDSKIKNYYIRIKKIIEGHYK